ncbi:class I SAM-dependent methyltransferase [Ekhidna sp.]|uniref:class I SAM-dependent methyltransferase n=1 Tax=Ekhidna sp. TaxID=2608089 RepID=UPI003C7DF9CA
MQAYEDIFNQRGRSYHLAMERYPNAREEEFHAAVKRLCQTPKSTILDLPAGGGYLQQYLSEDINYLAYDFSGEFNDNHSNIKKCKESKVDIDDESIDEVVSLAALHHIVARKDFYSEMYRILKDGGRLIIADAIAGSRIEEFLNGFLDQWNSMGHRGRFIKEEDLKEIREVGFNVKMETDKYHWNFDSRASAMDFFRLLFCLDLNPSDQEIMIAFKKLGVMESSGFSVTWELGFLTCQK